ncbi:MAG: rhomboid family intramembrane serine protease [Thermofilaceae archaeon]
MLPIGDDVRRWRRSIVTLLLIASNIIAFAYSIAVGFERVILENGFKPIYLFELSRMETLFTSLFLHGDPAHLVGNMLFLFIFGRSVEDRFGPLQYFTLYMLSGVAGSLMHTASLLLLPPSTLATQLVTPLIGASGAISGVIGAYILLYPHAKILTLVPFYYIIVLRLPARYFVLVWFIYQLVIGAASLRQPLTIAAWSHVGGFAVGAALSLVLKRLEQHYAPLSIRGQ